MSAANNQDDYGPPSTAAGSTYWPLRVECGTRYPKADFQFIIWPIAHKEQKKKPKSRWLDKQINRKGWKEN